MKRISQNKLIIGNYYLLFTADLEGFLLQAIDCNYINILDNSILNHRLLRGFCWSKNARLIVMNIDDIIKLVISGKYELYELETHDIHIIQNDNIITI